MLICKYVLQICSLLRGGIAERGGVRVGHRIIQINGQSVVAVPHERIVNLLATSIGEVRRDHVHFLLFFYPHPLGHPEPFSNPFLPSKIWPGQNDEVS